MLEYWNRLSTIMSPSKIFQVLVRVNKMLIWFCHPLCFWWCFLRTLFCWLPWCRNHMRSSKFVVFLKYSFDMFLVSSTQLWDLNPWSTMVFPWTWYGKTLQNHDHNCFSGEHWQNLNIFENLNDKFFLWSHLQNFGLQWVCVLLVRNCSL